MRAGHQNVTHAHCRFPASRTTAKASRQNLISVSPLAIRALNSSVLAAGRIIEFCDFFLKGASYGDNLGHRLISRSFYAKHFGN